MQISYYFIVYTFPYIVCILWVNSVLCFHLHFPIKQNLLMKTWNYSINFDILCVFEGSNTSVVLSHRPCINSECIFMISFIIFDTSSWLGRAAIIMKCRCVSDDFVISTNSTYCNTPPIFKIVNTKILCRYVKIALILCNKENFNSMQIWWHHPR